MSQYIEGDWHRSIIEGLMMPPSASVYIELGLRGCETINKVLPYCTQAHGVDIDSGCGGRLVHGVHFWNMSSDAFWSQYEGPDADCIFIDADHTYDATFADFNHALEHLAFDGVIAMHDTWPYQDGDFWEGYTVTTNGAWIVANEVLADERFSGFTIPRFPGLTLVKRNAE